MEYRKKEAFIQICKLVFANDSMSTVTLELGKRIFHAGLLCLEYGTCCRVMIILTCPLLEEIKFFKASYCLCTCIVLAEAHSNVSGFVQGSRN